MSRVLYKSARAGLNLLCHTFHHLLVHLKTRILPGYAATPIFSFIMHHHLNQKKQRESVFSQVETNVGVPAVGTPHCARAPEADSRWKNKSW